MIIIKQKKEVSNQIKVTTIMIDYCRGRKNQLHTVLMTVTPLTIITLKNGSKIESQASNSN